MNKAIVELITSPFKQNHEVPKVTYAVDERNIMLLLKCPSMLVYKAPWYAVGPYIQTAISNVVKKKTKYRRESIYLSFDNVEIALDWKEDDTMSARTPIVVCLHGLGGDSNSSYLQLFTDECLKRGSRSVVYNRRGHTTNVMPTVPGRKPPEVFPQHVNMQDMEEVVNHIRSKYPHAPKYLVGFSCGANLAVRYIAKHPKVFLAAASVCNGYDIWNLNTLRPEANKLGAKYLKDVLKANLNQCMVLAKQKGVDIDFEKALKSKTIGDFEKAVVVPAYGYISLKEYYDDASSHRALYNVRDPLLCLNSRDDPIIPKDMINIARNAAIVNPNIICVDTKCGGHIGWLESKSDIPWHIKVIFEYFGSVAENVYKK